MKKTIYVVGFALFASLFFSSCDSDKAVTEQEPGFSTLSPQEKKESMASAAIEVADEISAMQEDDAMVALKTLSSLPTPMKSLSYVKSMVNLKSTQNLSKIKSLLKAGELAAEIDSISGVYTYNFQTEDFVKTNGTNGQAVIKFPYDSLSNTNDCQLTMTAAIVTINDKYLGTTEAPSSISLILDVKEKKGISTVSFGASYGADGMPTLINSSLTLSSFAWNLTLSKSASEFKESFSFTKGTKTLFATTVEVGGNLNLEAVEDHMSQMEDSAFAVANGNISKMGTFVANFKSTIQVLDIKLVQTANTKDLAVDVEALMKAGTEPTVKQIADMLNKNMNIYIMYVSSNQKIADAVAYVTAEQGMSVQFMFSDNSSPIDAKTYFTTGFDDAIAALEEQVAGLQEIFPQQDQVSVVEEPVMY